MADLPNLKVLRPFRLKGEHIEPGSVVSKSDFENAGDWAELVTMTPQTCTQTDEKPTVVPGPKDRGLDRNAKRGENKMPA